MTITATASPIVFAGDGVSTVFSITFPYQYQTDLYVTLTNTATGVVTPQVLGSSYTVSPTANSPAATGTLTLLSVLPVGTTLTIYSQPPLTQTTHWTPNDPFPAQSVENAVDKLTLIAQELQAQIATSGGGGGGSAIVTTAVFAIAAVASSQSVVVNTIGTLVAGNTIQISTGAITVIGQITAIAGTTLTVTTLAITAGSVGTTMPVGASVQLGQVPGSNIINVQDAVTAASQMTTLKLTGSAALAAGAGALDLYIQSLVGNVATVKAYAGAGALNPNAFATSVTPGVLGVATASAASAYITSSTSGQVLRNASGTLGWGLLGPANITSASLTPPLFAVTNGPTVGYALTYANAGQFTWAAVGGSGVPGGGTTAQLLRGDTTWSNVLQMTAVYTDFQLQTQAGSDITRFAPIPGGMNVTANTTRGVNDKNADFNFNCVLTTFGGLAPIDPTPTYNNQPVETFTNNGYARSNHWRADASYWTRINNQTSMGSTFTIDLFSAAYYRLAGWTANCTFTVTDNSDVPTSFIYAAQVYVEIVAPGAFTITWPANVTWANGSSAPTLSATGISIVRLVRRQGQTQWIGYLESTGSNIPGPGSITSSSQFAGTGFLPVNLLSTTGSPSSSTFLNGAGAWAVPASGINAQQNGVAISGSPFSTINLTTNLTATNVGGVLTLSAAGGGGGTFSPATPYTWTATQTFNNSPILLNNSVSTMQQLTGLNSTNSTDGNLSGLTVMMTGTDGAYSAIDTTYVITSTPNLGVNAIKTGADFQANITTASSWIGRTNFVDARRINNVNADLSAMWENCCGPMQQFSSTHDNQGIVHSWTAGGTRIGECNYGNAWAEFGFSESRNVVTSRHAIGLEFFPNHLPFLISGPTFGSYPVYNVQWAVNVGAGSPGNDGFVPQHWISYMADQNGTSPFGVALKLWGSVGTFSTRSGGTNASATTNSIAAAIQISGTMQVGIDFSGYKGTNGNGGTGTTNPNTTTPATLVTDLSSRQSAIMLAAGQAICFSPPTGANTGVYIEYSGGHLRATVNGGSTWTNII